MPDPTTPREALNLAEQIARLKSLKDSDPDGRLKLLEARRKGWNDCCESIADAIAAARDALCDPMQCDAVWEGEVYHDLRSANIARQAAWCPDQVPDLSFRGNELAGEVGEVCNVVKKLERERQGWCGSRDTVEHLGEELADVVICADLVALSADIDLNRAVAAKFNATSEKVGLPHRLSAHPDTASMGAPPMAGREGPGSPHGAATPESGLSQEADKARFSRVYVWGAEADKKLVDTAFDTLASHWRTNGQHRQDVLDLHADLLARFAFARTCYHQMNDAFIHANDLIAEQTERAEKSEAALAAALARAERAEGAQGWQPMETAPKDGTYVLATDADILDGFPCAVAWDEEVTETARASGHCWWCSEASGKAGYHTGFFTHWHPMPAAPHPDPQAERADG